ncbi:5'-nucleotidase, lipoprotein e(P4) family [Chryseobacterium ginsengisoli]|uniref:5'-nucleotidase, lipoprotein e(P4) family n=1 Tax=Chryseobacterium ginsengisoli TaxID=363853 RepID=A0ABP9M216_9FLAO
MKKFNQIIGSCFLVFIISCQTATVNSSAKPSHQDPVYKNLYIHGKIYAAFYQQRAAEYEALCLQAYNIAKLRLDQALASRKESDPPLAIVSDIDETFLDNSYYAVSQAKMGKSYDKEAWKKWTDEGIAKPLSGSQEFYQYAASKGVQVFYITNRKEEERSGTTKNLKKYGFPLQNENNLILRQDSNNSKEDRRKKVAKNYNIVLFLGDNLADFSSLFDDDAKELQRSKAVKTLANDFGKKFIVLPNTGYGDWENSFFNYDKLSDSLKSSMIYDAVKTTP